MTSGRLHLTLLAGSLLLALIFGLALGAVGWVLFLTLSAWVAWHVLEYRRFARWVAKPLSRPENRDPSWQALSDAMYHSLRGARNRAGQAYVNVRRLRTVSEALPDAAVLTNENGAIETFNPSARELLNLSANDRGTHLSALVRVPELVALLRGAISEDLIEFASPFDDERRLETRRIRVDDQHYLLLVRDVSQLNRLLSMRQDFVANVSHELRTPLTVILGYLEALTDSGLDAVSQDVILAKLEPPAKRMKALVEDLLLLTRLESSAAPDPDELQWIDVPALIRQVADEAANLSGGRHQIEVDVEPLLRLQGHDHEIHSAITNLVSNAIRYSPSGGRIDIRWKHEGNGARLEVEDRGVGIAPEHQSRITERFYRVDLAGARIRGGTGLGLAIVKHVLKRHETVLRVTSRLGVGSRFYFDFRNDQISYGDPTGRAAPENVTKFPTIKKDISSR